MFQTQATGRSPPSSSSIGGQRLRASLFLHVASLYLCTRHEFDLLVVSLGYLLESYLLGPGVVNRVALSQSELG